MLAGPSRTVKRARKFRREMSVPDVVLWTRLRLRPGGFKFRRQHPAGSYILDFFCNEAKLAIEVDGASHDMGDRPARDAMRDQWLDREGVDTLRIAAGDVLGDADAVVEVIVAACLQHGNPLHHASHGPPPRSGEETE
ncbi:endonuclease domain-containing protein [Sphingomonas sp. ASY06-1R]|uniref:endonuclease domain-containing protein n=1 Tax=Sphingomonas sp. ASY06-1R TaxID=3445771 RepID=UPI003FA30E20